MSAISPFPKSKTPVSGDFSSPQAEGVGSSIRTLFEGLSAADQQVVMASLRGAELIPASRAGDVLKSVVHFLPRKQKWTATEIKSEIAKSGVEASSREVFNAIGYLVRKKRVKRMGAGRYLIDNAFAVVTSSCGAENQ